MNKMILGNSRYVDLLCPFAGVSNMSIGEIAHALANINRFQGRLSRQVSVAEHSCVQACYALVGSYKRKDKRDWLAYHCLLHDVSEVLTGDISGVIKSSIDCFELNALETAFELRFCSYVEEELDEYAKRLDTVTAAVEAENCGLSDPYWQNVIRNNKQTALFLTSSYIESCYEKPSFSFYKEQIIGIQKHLGSWDSLFVFLYNYLCKELNFERSY